MEITYHLSQFDGPLDMLLFMLDKAKIDIRDIFISEIHCFVIDGAVIA